MADPAQVKTNAPAPPKALAIKWPTIEEILVAKGLSIEEANRRVAAFAAKFPYTDGAPEAAVREFLSEMFDSGHILAVMVDAFRAFEQLKRTGKGPVAHSSAEVA